MHLRTLPRQLALLVVAIPLLMQAQSERWANELQVTAGEVSAFYNAKFTKTFKPTRSALVEIRSKPEHVAFAEQLRSKLDHQLIRESAEDYPPHFIVIEHTDIAQVWDAQKRTCDPDVDATCVVDLGKTLAANSVLLGNLVQSGKNSFTLYLKSIDVESGRDEQSWEVQLHYKAKAEKAIRPTALRTTEEGRIISTGIAGSYENYFNAYHSSLFVDVDFKPTDSPYRLGLRLGYMPGLVDRASLPYDLAHVTGILVSNSTSESERFINYGNTPFRTGDFALISTEPEVFTFDPVTGSTDDGITGFEFDRIKMTNMAADRFSGHALLKVYLNEEDRLKAFAELGVGMDYVRYSASYEVTRTKVQQDGSFNYSTSTSTFTGSSYEYDGYKKDLLFGNLLFGGGLEMGRFALGFNWRSIWNQELSGANEGYRRLNGDLMILPVLNEKEAGSNENRIILEGNGAVNYGRANVEGTEEENYNGNAVNRFTDKSNFLFYLRIRVY
jgi:hypothetical protein